MIRLARKEDLEAIAKIDAKAFQKGNWSLENYYNEFENNPFSTLIVFEKEYIVGFVDYWATFEIGDITRVAVLPDFQGQKIASDLLSFALSELKNKGCECCHLEVRVSNKRALSIYDKLGFKVYQKRGNYYENEEDALLMSKALEEEI